jgi:hypothetical protein
VLNLPDIITAVVYLLTKMAIFISAIQIFDSAIKPKITKQRIAIVNQLFSAWKYVIHA